MTTDLEAAVARLKRDLDAIAAETPGAKEARGDVRLLLADWERRGADAEYVQNAVDTVIHYRNLAIKCGAAPDDMLGAYDRKLCVDHNPDDRDGYDFSDNRETWAEVEKVAAERDAARAEVERLQGLLTVTDAALVRTGEQARKAEAEAKFGAGLAQDLSGELARLRERDAQVRSILQRVDDEACKTDWSGNPDDLPESRPLDNEAVAMDMREALELLKETP